MKRKLKLKKGVYYLIIIIILLVIGINFGLKKYNEYLYHQTNEYKLLQVGYNIDEVNTLLKTFQQDKDIEYLLNNKYDKNNIDLLNQKYFLLKNFYKYLEYIKKHKKESLENVIRTINTHLNEEYYENSYESNTSYDYLLISNKHYKLNEDYAPDNLVAISQDYAWGDKNSKTIRSDVLDAYLKMWEAAKNEGYYLMINSAYRSYQDQEKTFDNIKNKSGERYADSIAARPGYSEHQTGLALDIFSKQNSSKAAFSESSEAEWLKNNSYKYGFILRYPKEAESITGFSYESWHFRYVGIDAAKYIYENNITFEEYYAYFVEK